MNLFSTILTLESGALNPQIAAIAGITYLVVLILIFFLYINIKNICITTTHKLSYNFKLGLLRLAVANGTVAKVAGSVTESTEVTLGEEDLNQLIGCLLQEIGNSTQITVAQLQSFGLHTQTVVDYLISKGYVIIF
jgi:hypothetical protein